MALQGQEGAVLLWPPVASDSLVPLHHVPLLSSSSLFYLDKEEQSMGEGTGFSLVNHLFP